MAKEGGLILLIGGAAVAWYGYTQGWFSSLFGTPAASTIPPASVPPATPYVAPANPPTSSAPVTLPTTAPATLSAQLTAAAGSAAQFGQTMDQWSYYYAQLPGKSPIPAATFATMLQKVGITDATRSNPQSVDFFVGALNQVGLSGWGLGQLHPGVRHYIAVPRMVRGRGFGQYTMADLRRAGVDDDKS